MIVDRVWVLDAVAAHYPVSATPCQPAKSDTARKAAQRERDKAEVERWKQTFDFLRKAGLTKPGTDYSKAYTLSIVRDIKVLP